MSTPYDNLPVWPWRWLRGAAGERALLNQRVVTGGASLSGVSQAAQTTGGGWWSLELQGITLSTPDLIRCARAWSAHLDGGAALCVAPFFDLGQAPRPRAGGGFSVPGRPASSDDYFAQEPGFGVPLIVAKVTTAAALRATTVRIVVSQGGRLRGGEHFSITHATLGPRLYRIGQITPAAGGGFDCTIRPPLRAPVAANTAAEFDVPRSVMRLDPASAADFEPVVTGNRLATVSARLVEGWA